MTGQEAKDEQKNELPGSDDTTLLLQALLTNLISCYILYIYVQIK